MTWHGYRKLTPKNRTLTGFSQAWLGEDHLLVVNSVRFVEHYQRFSLADIQAIVIGDGPARGMWQTADLAISVAFILCAFLVSSRIGKGFFVVLGGCALVFIIRDMVRGPSRRCFVQTSVSRRRLPAVSRRRVARDFLAVITPAIEAAQVSLRFPAMAASPPSLNAGPAESSSLGFAGPAEIQPPPIVQRRSYVAEMLFVLFILDAGIVWAALRSPASGAVGYLPTVYLAEVTLAIVALFHRQSRFAGFAFGLVIVALALIIVDVFTVSGVVAWLTLVNSVRQGSNRAALNSVWLSQTGTLLFSTLWRTSLGLLGLAACYIDRRGARP